MKVEFSKKSDKPKPLEGIRVIEYGLFHAGPGAGAILGDLGAEVIKIENRKGDGARFWTSVGNMDISDSSGESIIFQISSRNKKGICLDIETDEGREILHKLIKASDVFLTNLRKSTKANMKIDYPSISKINPRIIHASVSGYGTEGPLSDIGAFDPLGQACSGMMFVTGSEVPSPMNIGILDQATAIALSHAIITALFVRERQGIAQEVHVSLYSTALWLQHINLMLANVLSKNPVVSKDRATHSPLRNIFACKDGKWIMGTHHPEEKYWERCCKALGRTDLLEDSNYTDEKMRPHNYPELNAIFDEVFAQKNQAEWMLIFAEYQLMFAPVQKINDVTKDPQALLNDYIVPCNYQAYGELNVLGYPIHFSECQAGLQSSAPKNGEHTDEVLAGLGYNSDEIKALKENGIVN